MSWWAMVTGASNMEFAEYLKQLRNELGLTLREFGTSKGYDAAYISRLENGILKAPSEPEKLKALAKAYELEPETTQWVEFHDLAAVNRSEIPEDLKDNPQVINFLPAFYRTIRNDKLNNEEVDKLLELIKGEFVDGSTKR